MKIFALVSSVALSAAAAAIDDAPASYDTSSYPESSVIHRDVAVIGGGAAGTYAAIRLGDLKKTAIVVEKQAILGGHTETYRDPATGTYVDYGVRAYQNNSAVSGFFGRFGIPLAPFIPARTMSHYADFTTGQLLPNFTASTNISGYTAQLNKYPYLKTGFDQLQYPVASDLLLPFSDFVTKYSLQNEAYTIYGYTAGVGTLLKQLTINVFQSLGLVQLAGFAGGSVTTAAHNNGALYTAAQKALGDNALLSSTVTAASRPYKDGSVRLIVQTPAGKKLLVVKQVLITIPTTNSNMAPFAPDSKESDIFNRFATSGYWVGLVSNTGLPANTSYVNADPKALYDIPNMPEAYSISATAVPGLYSWGYGSDTPVSQADAQGAISTAIKKLNGTGSPNFVATGNHNPSKLVVSADDIANGFYKKLFALNGYRNTWYTGAQFFDSSSGVWNYTDAAVLPGLVAAAS